jgi:hypothetical protein
MRQLVFALALCFAVSPLASSATTHPVAHKATKHKVKARRAPKAKKRVVRRGGAA